MFQELLTSFGGIEDARQEGKVDHLLIDVLAITVCAVLAHAETFEDIALYGKHKEKWLRRFLDLPNGIPSHDTFRRVFMLVEAERFEASFWLGHGRFLSRLRMVHRARLLWMARSCDALSIGARATRPCMWSAHLRRSPD